MDLRPRKRFVVARILPREFDRLVQMPWRHYQGEPSTPNVRRAIVEAVGPQVRDVKVGDIVLVGKFAGLETPESQDIMHAEVDRRIMREQEIEAVLGESD